MPLAHEQAGLLAEQLGGPLLERVDGRVVAEDVVADLGLGHRPAHLGGRLGDGVGAEVDEAVGHGRRVYGAGRARAAGRRAAGAGTGCGTCYPPPSPHGPVV